MRTLNVIIAVMLMAYGHTVSGQKVLDTIQANSQMNVALFFPSPIKQAITGNTKAIFTYNREEAQYFGLLQSTANTITNLLVVTMDGQAYEFKVAYRENVAQTHFFVDKAHSIGPVQPLPGKKGDSLASHTARFAFLSGLLSSDGNGALASVRRKGIRLRLKRLVYRNAQVFMVVEVHNRSGIDFEVGTLEALRINGSLKRRSSYQETRLEPHYIFERPKIIKTGTSQRFVLVLPKFVLFHKEHLRLILLESRGGRRLELNY